MKSPQATLISLKAVIADLNTYSKELRAMARKLKRGSTDWRKLLAKADAFDLAIQRIGLRFPDL